MTSQSVFKQELRVYMTLYVRVLCDRSYGQRLPSHVASYWKLFVAILRGVSFECRHYLILDSNLEGIEQSFKASLSFTIARFVFVLSFQNSFLSVNITIHDYLQLGP